jgi:hypothetical protein
MADEVKRAGIGYILKNSYGSPTHGRIEKNNNFRVYEMILEFEGAIGGLPVVRGASITGPRIAFIERCLGLRTRFWFFCPR